MALKIRLRRMGSTNKPSYRVVVADARAANRGRFKEIVGWYDPKKRGDNFKLDLERIEYWQGKGAQTSDTVKSLIKKAGRKPAAKAAPPPLATPVTPPPVEEMASPAEEATTTPPPVAPAAE